MLPVMDVPMDRPTPPSEVRAALRVPSAELGPIRRVMLATDLSPASGPAAAQAISTASVHRAQLIVLSVVDPKLLRLPSGRFLRRIDQERAQVEAGAHEIATRARQAGIDARYLVWEGDPAEVILEAAAAEEPDVVVMGSHGRGPIGRLIMGSVSRRVSDGASCRVVVVPG